MKENQLYTCIIYLLYNIFNNNNLKAQLIINKEFKIKIIQQLCNLLTLEKDYNTNFSGNKFTVPFTQVLANIINEVATIEKVDEMPLNIIEEQYQNCINYINNIFSIKKNIITQENLITLEIIEKIPVFIDKNIINNAKQQLNEKNNNNLNNNKEQEKLINTKIINNNNIPEIETEKNVNSYSNKIDINQFMKQIQNISKHPRFDPRFYPYTTKPKYIILYKKIVAILIIISTISLLILWILTSQLNFNIDTKVTGYKLSNGGFIIIGGANEIQKNINNHNFKYNWQPFLKLKMLGAGNQILNLFNGLLPIIPATYMIFQLLGNKRYLKDRYTVKLLTIITGTIVLLYSSLSFIKILLPNYLHSMITNFTILNNGIKVNDPLIFKGILKPNYNLLHIINQIVNKIKNTLTYKIIIIFAYITIILNFIVLISIILLIIMMPKIDRQKIIYANEEYQKFLSASMKGEKYEIDPSLFEE